MSPLHASTLTALETLRRQSALVVELCDAILYAQKSVASHAARQLVTALWDLRSRAQTAIDASEMDVTPCR